MPASVVSQGPSVLDASQGPLLLQICGGSRKGEIVAFHAPKCTLGSAPRCTHRILARGVQPVHCLIVRGPVATVVRSVSADTRLNGRPFDDAVLKPGDRLTIGPVQFQVICLQALYWPDPSQLKKNPPEGWVQPGAPHIGRDTASPFHATALRQSRGLTPALDDRTRPTSSRENSTFERHPATSAVERIECTPGFAGDQPADPAEELNGRLSDLDPHQAELARQVAALQAARNEMDARVEKLNVRQAELDQWACELEKRRAELEKRQAALANHQAALDLCQANLDRRQTDFDERQSELATRQAELETREAELATRQAELETRQAELASRQAELETREAELETREAELATRQAELETREAELAIRQAKLDTQQAELDTRHAQLDTRQAELDARQAELDSRQGRLDKREAELDARQAELDRREEGLGQQHADLTEQRAELDRQKARLDARQAALEARQAELDRLAAELQARQEELAQQPGWLQDGQQQLEKGLADLQRREAAADEVEGWQAAGMEPPATPIKPFLFATPAMQTASRGEDETPLGLSQKTGECESAPEQAPTGAPMPLALSGGERAPATNAPVDAETIFRRLGIRLPLDDEPEETLLPGAATGSASTFAASAAPHPEEESIDAYMARLLERLRQGSGGGPSGTQHSMPQSAAPAEAAPESQLAQPREDTGTADATGSAEPGDVVSQPERRRPRPVPKSAAPEDWSHLAAMRELANLSARNALDRHGRNMLRRAIRSKLAVLALALTAGTTLVALWWRLGAGELAYYSALVCYLVAVVWGIQYAVLTGRLIVSRSGHLGWHWSGTATQKSHASPDPAAASHPTNEPGSSA